MAQLKAKTLFCLLLVVSNASSWVLSHQNFSQASGCTEHIVESNCTLECILTDCEDRSLSIVPKDISYFTTILILRDNAIATIGPYDFSRFSKLRTLDLANNILHRLHIDAFQDLPYLEHLDLSRNRLNMDNRSFPNGVFRNLVSIKSLNIISYTCISSYSNREKEPLYYVLGEISSLKILKLTPFCNKHLIFGEEYASLSNLEELHVTSAFQFYDFPNKVKMDNSTFYVFRFTKLRLLLIKNLSGMLIPGMLDHLQYLKRLGIMSSPFGLQEVFDILRSASHLRLETLIADSINTKPVFITANILDIPAIHDLKELTLRANVIFGLDFMALNYLHKLQYISMGFNQLISFTYNDTKITRYEVMHSDAMYKTLAEIEVVDFSYLLYEDPNEYLKLYPDIISEIDAYLKKTPMDLIDKNLTLPSSHQGKYLYLDHIPVKFLLFNDWGFPYLSSFKYINISYITIAYLNRKHVGLENLQVLDASYARLEEIKESAFSNTTNLVHLDFGHNELGTQKDRFEKSFQDLKHLKTLDLSHNKIYSIHTDAFDNLPNLHELDISANVITSTIYITFNSCSKLKFINISSNQVNFLTLDFVTHLEELNTRTPLRIDLSENPLLCSCKTLNFIKWIQATNVTVEKLSTYLCSTENGSQVLLEALDVKELNKTCSTLINDNVLILPAWDDKFWSIPVAVGGMVIFTTWVIVRLNKFNKVYRRIKRVMQPNQHFLYDAYFIYDNKDDGFVVQLGDTLLQRKNIFIRDHPSAYEPGYELDRIKNGIQASRKAIIMLSKELIYGNRQDEIQEVLHTHCPLIICDMDNMCNSHLPAPFNYLVQAADKCIDCNANDFLQQIERAI